MGKRLYRFNAVIVFLIVISVIANSFFFVNAVSTGENTVNQADNNVLPSGKIVSMEASVDNTVILMEDGSVWAWGDNSYRQLGEGVEAVQKNVFKPVKVSGLVKIKSIAVGNGFILALEEGGQVWGVGNNTSNAISTANNTGKVSKPIKVEGLYNITQIAAGTNYAVAVRSDGTIWLWGDYRYKIKSLNTIIQAKSIPDVEKIYALRYNTIVIDKDGTGWISRGKQTEPKQITEVDKIIDIIEGANFTYAVKDDGSVWSWNIFTLSVEQIEGLSNIKSIVSVKDDDFIAIDKEGSIWSWEQKNKTVIKNSNISNVKSIAAGTSHFAALKSDNTIWSWGSNGNGQLGNGGGFFFSKPIRLESMNNVKQIAASKYFTLAVKDDGTVWAWGNNENGQLGNGTKESDYSPVQVKGISDVEKVAAGISHAIAVKKDGTVWTWGSNLSGELGDGTYEGKLIPTQIKGINDVKDIAAGNGFSIAVKNNGSVWVWGNSGYGEDGDSIYKNKTIPARVNNFNSAKMVTAGYDHGLALKADRSVWAWGSNEYGQFGYTPDDSVLKKNKAVRVPGILDIMQVSAGYSHNLVLKVNGTVVGWGSNDYGQLGAVSYGKSHNIYSKLAINGFVDVVVVVAGNNSSFAIKKDGTLWAWGDNSLGQLGTNNTVSSNLPVQVLDMSKVKYVSAGSGYSAAAKQDGTLWVWGSNVYGQLGIGEISSDYEKLPIKSLVN
ncbi:MAG: RCC1 domain-containing protein [Clostridia bacterium]